MRERSIEKIGMSAIPMGPPARLPARQTLPSAWLMAGKNGRLQKRHIQIALTTQVIVNGCFAALAGLFC
jgi:hypothetical protein